VLPAEAGQSADTEHDNVGRFAGKLAFNESAAALYQRRPQGMTQNYGPCDAGSVFGNTCRLPQRPANDPRENSYNELVCRLNTIKLSASAGTVSEMKSEFAALFGLKSRKFPEGLRERAESKFNEAEALRKARIE